MTLRVTTWPREALVLCVRLYQVTLRPLVGGHCRFFPTCSDYGVQALREHGAIRGTWLTMRRLARCHPLGGSGLDPVPTPRCRCAVNPPPAPRESA